MLVGSRVLLAAALTLVAAAAEAGPEDRLAIGDPAPPLQVKEYVQGTPVTTFQKGRFYVVDLWSSWAAPCRLTIPHLNDLQRKYPKVNFIGVSIWEENQSGVKPFVEQMGRQMTYTVAVDRVPDGSSGIQGQVARRWMRASGMMGIPSAFIINKEGRVAWMGETASLDVPLSKVVAGTWDMDSARTRTERLQEQSRKLLLLSQKLERASRERDQEALIAGIDEAIADDPSIEVLIGLRRFNLLLDKPEKAAPYAAHLVDDTYRDDAAKLNVLAWSIIRPDGARPGRGSELAAVALRAALRADKLAGGKDGAVADTLAAAYFVNDDVRKALDAQERAVRYVKGTIFEKDPDIPRRLEEYRRAAGK